MDMSRVAARTADIVAGMVALNRAAFAAGGSVFLLGHGRFVAPRDYRSHDAAPLTDVLVSPIEARGRRRRWLRIAAR